MYRTYIQETAGRSLQESKNRQVQGSAELECRYIVGSFPRDLQLLESPTYLSGFEKAGIKDFIVAP